MSRVDQILASVMTGSRGGASLPEILCAAGTQALSISGAGMALMTQEGHAGVVAATDGAARVMEDLQFTLGEGPCVDASQSGRPVLQPDLAETAPVRWPGFGPGALDAGIRAIFALPLQVGAISLGVLDLYRSSPGNLDEGQMTEALAFADAATVILLHLQDQTAPGESLHPQLTDPLGSRAEIHQATGMIAVQAAVGLAEALLLLRAHAFAAERTAIETARDVVARRLHFHPEDGHHE